jgi:uncharacterized membrane protein YhhN
MALRLLCTASFRLDAAYLKVIRMLSQPRLRPSHAMVAAIAALVVALGGDAFASIPGPDGMISSWAD